MALTIKISEKILLNILAQYFFNYKVNEIICFLHLTVQQFLRSRQIFKISTHFGFFSNEMDVGGRIVVKTDSVFGKRPYPAMRKVRGDFYETTKCVLLQ